VNFRTKIKDKTPVFSNDWGLTGGLKMATFISAFWWELRVVFIRVTAVLLLLALSTPANALQIAQQGRLRAPSGVSVDGAYKITFSLYKNAYTTAKLWSETWLQVNVKEGLFSVALGAQTPMDLAKLSQQSALWVGVRVGNEPELARRQIHAIPQAGFAHFAASAGGFAGDLPGLECTGCIDPQDIADAGVTEAKIAAGGVGLAQTGFGWALGESIGGSAMSAAGVECDQCITQNEMVEPVAFKTDLLFTGALLAKLGCVPGERPILGLNEFGKKKWTCARATTSYGMAVVDPWGFRWDGVPRVSKKWADAKTDCEAVGGRLPTATELWRNNYATGTGSIAVPNATDYLWTRIPRQSSRYVLVRLSDGLVSNASPNSNYRYRCVWPLKMGNEFSQNHCNGPPGSTCYMLDGYHFMDMSDRAPLTMGAAASECAFHNARIPELWELETAIRSGLPGGSGTNQWTAGQYETCWGSGCATRGAPFWVLQWQGTNTAWYYDQSTGGINSMLWHTDDHTGSGWSNTEITDTGAGPVHGMWGNSPNSVTKSYSGIPAHTHLRIKLRYWGVDSWDNEWGRLYVDDTLVWEKQRTSGNCNNGWSSYSGSFPNPYGGNSTSHKCYFDVDVIVPHSGTSMEIKVATTINQAENDESWGFQNLVIETGGSSGINGQWHDTKNRFRCIGTVNRNTLNSPKGGAHQDASMFINVDDFDRSSSNWFAATHGCFVAKGHLLQSMELWGLIRNGLAGSGNQLWSAQQGDLQPLTVEWKAAGAGFWPPRDFQEGDGRLTQKIFLTSRNYRCAFYPTLPPSAPPACNGGCFQLVKDYVRVYADGANRDSASYWEAQDDCSALGGRLPTGRDMVELVRDGWPNGNAAPIWTAATMYDNADSKVYKLVANWFNVQPAWAPSNNLNGNVNGYGSRNALAEEEYRCVWSNEVH
jgi:hypothetical protein